MSISPTQLVSQQAFTPIGNEEQTHIALKINILVQGLNGMKQFFQTHPRFTQQEYQETSQCLDYFRLLAQSLPEDDPTIAKEKYLQTINQYRQMVMQKNPDAWKIDWIARGIIIGSLAAFFSYTNGTTGLTDSLMGGAVMIGLQIGFSQLFRLFTKS